MFNIRENFAKRIGGDGFGKKKSIYKFEQIKKAKEEVLKYNSEKDILDLGIGEPDDMADLSIRNTLKSEVDLIENRVYADNGIHLFKKEVGEYFKKHFNLSLNVETEIMHCPGVKSGLAYFPKMLIEKDDYALIPRPSYPVLKTQVEWLGGKIYYLDLKKSSGFLPNLDKIPEAILKSSKLIYLNYPNNPTGVVADKSFYEELVSFAIENKIVVVQDAAYINLCYGKRGISFLEIDNAKKVGVEFHSFSKAFNMTGWRLGFIVGNALLIEAFAQIKSNMDSGQFIPIQKAGITALRNYDKIVPLIAKKYKRRLIRLADILKAKGFSFEPIQAGFFLYVFIPKGIKNICDFKTASQFSEFLIKEKLIVTVPWDEVEFEPAIRFSVTFQAFSEKEENKIFNELKLRLEDLDFIF